MFWVFVGAWWMDGWMDEWVWSDWVIVLLGHEREEEEEVAVMWVR